MEGFTPVECLLCTETGIKNYIVCLLKDLDSFFFSFIGIGQYLDSKKS